MRGDLAGGLDEATAAFSALSERHRSLEVELAQRESLDREMREMMISAQREIEQMEAEAKREAAAIRERARLNALEVGAALEEEHGAVESRLADVRAIEADLRARSRVIVEQALRELGTPPDALRAPEQLASTGLVDEAPVALAIDDTQAIPILVASSPVQEDVTHEQEDTDSISPLPSSEPSETSQTNVRTRRRSFALSLGILLVGALVAVGIWQLSAADGASTASASAVPASPGVATTIVEAVETQASQPNQTVEAPPEETVPDPATAEPEPATLAIAATRGDCWLQVRRGSANGKLLYDGFLYQGDRETFSAKRLWIRVGNGANLTAMLNGSTIETLPAGTGDAVVSAQGVRIVSLG